MEEIFKLVTENYLLKLALKEIEAILGPPCPDNDCAGCGHEMADAAAIVKRALHGSEIPRKCPGLSSWGPSGRLACTKDSGHDGRHGVIIDGFPHEWDGGLEGTKQEG